MKSFVKSFAPTVMAAAMLLTCATPSAFAEEPAVQTNPTTIAAHPNNTMSPTKTVYPIGTKTFYKVSGSVITYADRDEGGYKAISSAYVKGNPYNTSGKSYGMYVTTNGAVHYIDLDLCRLDAGVYDKDKIRLPGMDVRRKYG